MGKHSVSVRIGKKNIFSWVGDVTKNPYDSFRNILFFGSSCADTGGRGDSNDTGSGGSVGTWPWHYHEGQGPGHLAERVADVVNRLAFHPESVHFQNLVTCWMTS